MRLKSLDRFEGGEIQEEDDVAYTFRLVLGGFVGTYHFGCLSVRQEL